MSDPGAIVRLSDWDVAELWDRWQRSNDNGRFRSEVAKSNPRCDGETVVPGAPSKIPDLFEEAVQAIGEEDSFSRGDDGFGGSVVGSSAGDDVEYLGRRPTEGNDVGISVDNGGSSDSACPSEGDLLGSQALVVRGSAGANLEGKR